MGNVGNIRTVGMEAHAQGKQVKSCDKTGKGMTETIVLFSAMGYSDDPDAGGAGEAFMDLHSNIVTPLTRPIPQSAIVGGTYIEA